MIGLLPYLVTNQFRDDRNNADVFQIFFFRMIREFEGVLYGDLGWVLAHGNAGLLKGKKIIIFVSRTGNEGSPKERNSNSF